MRLISGLPRISGSGYSSILRKVLRRPAPPTTDAQADEVLRQMAEEDQRFSHLYQNLIEAEQPEEAPKAPARRLRFSLPSSILARWESLKSLAGELTGKKQPLPPPITDEFLESLTLEEAVALLQAEMEETEAEQATALVKRSHLPESLQHATEKVHDLVKRRTMTLTIENEVVRIVVFQGREVLAWGVANPKKDPDRGLEMGILDEEYPSRLKGLLEYLQFHRLRVVTDLPLYVPLQRHFHIPRIPKRYLDSVIVSEVLESVPFAEEEVDVPWQMKKNSQGDEVFAVAVPKKAVDQHVDLLKEMNVQPSAAYSRATALTFAAGISNAIMVHLAPGQAAIVLVREGVAEIVHRLELLSSDTSVDEQAEMVAQAIDQVLGSYQRVEPKAAPSHPPLARGEMEGSALPVLLTGQLAGEALMAEALRRALPYEVLPFAPPVTYPEHFVPQEYAVNIGLALSDWNKTRPRRKISRQRMPSVSLLSERHLPKPLPVWPAATFITLLMLGVMAINVSSQVNSVELEAGTLETRLQNLERQERRHRLERGQARAIEERIAATELFTDTLNTKLDTLDQDTDFLLQRAGAMTREALPSGVQINSIGQQGDGFGISGTADTYEDVLRYTANLRETGLFSDVRAVRLSGGGSDDGEGKVNFSVDIKINEDFLSSLEEAEEQTEEIADAQEE
jgi:Tfp pilus assembly protein PilN